MPPTLVISDANILLDMGSGGLLEPMFRLDFRFAIPDVLLLTELKRESTRLRGLGLVAKEIGPKGVDYILALSVKAGRLGVGRMDLFALALAKQEDCMLLSGDARLRALAQEEGTEVHGTLWLVEAMFRARRIRLVRAAQAYERMRVAGRRLPWDEVERQLKAFATRGRLTP